MKKTPTGSVASDKEANEEWHTLIAAIEEALNVRVYGYNPRLSFVCLDDDGKEVAGASVQIPVWLANRILDLNDRLCRSSAEADGYGTQEQGGTK